ncbi:acyl-CoA dehydrogenase [Aquicoccus sp. SCR17]|nr:acyl-CoA dehydrogenase [Carideicomes alvinocaridis]
MTLELVRPGAAPDRSRLLKAADQALEAAERYAAEVRRAVASQVAPGGRQNSALAREMQRSLHGMAWVATTVQAMAAGLSWARRLETAGRLGEAEALVLQVGLREYLEQLAHGVPMSQAEMVRPPLFSAQAAAAELTEAAAPLIADEAEGREARRALADHLASGGGISDTLEDAALDMIRDQFRRFVDARITPNAMRWHLADNLIPMEVVDQLSDLGVFGICLPEDHGGLAMGKLAMCVVTEELSRGWVAAGSLGTRSEIAGELIATAGTPEQKEKYLARIAAGRVLPAAVFTEPDTGSDLAHLRSRATRTATGWRLDGRKTWITHAARSDLMTVLARTDPDEPGHGGLSMFLLDKTRGTESRPFPDAGISGSDIEVLGYRGMREYDISFDGVAMSSDALLGGVEGEGFRQLMQTFEGARIQTAARAIGVARNANQLALQYAVDRRQFGRPILDFPRVSDKLAVTVAETIFARELTYYAAREKDKARRCDIEAGMAKLLAGRVAWSAADCGLQIHGGLGYALETPISRVFCDARILNIFEGAAEIQAQVISRGLLAGQN